MGMKDMQNMHEKRNGRKRMIVWIACNAIALAAIFLILNVNLLAYPVQGMKTTQNDVSFSWNGLSDVQVDENPDFTSPLMVRKENPVLKLEPGTYYWKAGMSEVRSFVIDSEITVSLNGAQLNNESAVRIENQGNTRILLNILGAITGKVIMEPDAVTYENDTEIEKVSAEEYGN